MVLESDLEKNEIVNENKIYKEIDYFFAQVSATLKMLF